MECHSIMANANTVFNGVAYNSTQKLTAYACANMVLVADTLDTRRVYFNLGGHEKRVNTVSWLNETTLVSVSDRIVVCEGKGVDGANWRIKQEI